MHDGPDDVPRRRGRTRADDPPPWPPRKGPRERDDDRSARRDRRAAGDRADPETGAARRRAERGGPPQDGERLRDPARPGTRRRGASEDGAPPRDGRGPRAGGADVVLGAIADERTGAMPPVPADGADPAQQDPYTERPSRRTGRRPGATDSRQTGLVAPVPPRRRARDDPPDHDGTDEPGPPPGPRGRRPSMRRAPAPETPAGESPARENPGRTGPPRAAGPRKPRTRKPPPRTAPASDAPNADAPAGEPVRARTGTEDPPRRRPAAAPGTPPEDPRTPDGTTGPATRALRFAGVAAAVLVFAVCAFGFSSRAAVDGGVRTVAALDPQSDAISSRSTQTADENVLVLGLPADRSRTPETARTDTAVLVHIPAGGAQAVTLGLPPSLEVNRPPCRRWDPASGAYGETVPAESRTAFSAAFDVGGPACTVGVVQQLTGLVVTRFVALDLTGASDLVNAVRGVGVCTERPVVDAALGPVVPRAGNTVLAGAEAERFAAATGVDDTSPVNRVQRQQRVLADVLDRALSTTSLITPGAAGRAAQALSGAVMTDGEAADELLVLSRALGTASGEGAAPPYVGVPVSDQPNTRGHLELRRSESSDLFSALRQHEPLPAEAAAEARSVGSVTPPPGVVDVVNAGGKTGLAADVAATLRGYGYVVGAVRDAPVAADTLVRFSPDRADTAGPLAASIAGARQEPAPPGGPVLELVLGSSFPGPDAIAPPAPVSAGDCG